MITIGVTGGIGSGKSYICKILEALGHPVYYCDNSVKRLHLIPNLHEEIAQAHGEELYLPDGNWNRDRAIELTKSDPKFLNNVGKIITPYLLKDIESYKKQNENSKFMFIESALFHKSRKLLSQTDRVVLVIAPFETRMERIKQRDPLRTDEEIKLLLKNQKNFLITNADFWINNDNVVDVKVEVEKILSSLQA